MVKFFLRSQWFQMSCSSIHYFSIDILSTPFPPPPLTNFVATNKSGKVFFFPWEDWLTNSPRITSRISLVPDVIRSPYIKNVSLSVLQTTSRVSVAVALWISGNVTVLTYRAFKRTGFSTVEAERKWIFIANSSGLWSYDNHGWCAVWKMK